jgi:A/G-specific adenine glycosylase
LELVLRTGGPYFNPDFLTQQQAGTAVKYSAKDWRRCLESKLLAWFRRHARDLPWRRTRDLYAIWVSEIMLQQTQVAAVVPYWTRFLDHFPDIASLASADEQDVLRLWEGLGYYRRARQLHAAARKLVADHGGQFPAAIDVVQSLPGIGRYTAGAILSIGLDQRLPILEANSIRVLSRLTAYRGDVSSTAGRRFLWTVAEAVLPPRQCGAFNQALMELGSEICTSRSPACGRCPVATLCQARKQNQVAGIPRPAKTTNYEDVTEIAVVVRHGRRVALRHCQRGERWAGLWDFPRFAAAAEKTSGRLARQIAVQTRNLLGVAVVPGSHLVTLKHGVTRFRITLHCYEASLKQRPNRGKSSEISDTARWVAIEELSSYPLSVTGRKISRLLT